MYVAITYAHYIKQYFYNVFYTQIVSTSPLIMPDTSLDKTHFQ